MIGLTPDGVGPYDPSKAFAGSARAQRCHYGISRPGIRAVNENQMLSIGAQIVIATVTLWAESTGAPAPLALTRIGGDDRFALNAPGGRCKGATLYLIAKGGTPKAADRSSKPHMLASELQEQQNQIRSISSAACQEPRIPHPAGALLSIAPSDTSKIARFAEALGCLTKITFARTSCGKNPQWWTRPMPLKAEIVNFIANMRTEDRGRPQMGDSSVKSNPPLLNSYRASVQFPIILLTRPGRRKK
jgi:hypothetical protein